MTRTLRSKPDILGEKEDLNRSSLFFAMSINLYDYQIDAIRKMKTGCILCGGVGSGKSRTSIAYYCLTQGGKLSGYSFALPKRKDIKDLYIITTARKRDTREWEGELCYFLMSVDKDINRYSNKVIVDSWNNIKKYKDIKDAFFIFDEQRVVGYGAWTMSFLSIAKHNQWILLSATPGDTWMDYVPVFIANGYFKNKSEFTREHVVFKRFSKFPQVDRYLGTGRLLKMKNSLLVNMDFDRPTESHHIDVIVDYDVEKYKDVVRNRWNYRKAAPIENASELCYEMRRVVNSDYRRVEEIKDILEYKKRLIIFYNFDYELDILSYADWGSDVEIAEWNGHKHQDIPDSESWIYLVQYTAGAEGWNCIKTDTIVFYSQNYSYKTMIQSAGRIDRLNTPYKDLYYYHLKSRSSIDIAIARALKNKKNFNEGRFVNG